MLLKFGYGEEIYIKKSEEDLNIEENFAKARYLAYGKLFDLGEFAKSKVKDKEPLSKIEYYSGKIYEKVSEYESKIRLYVYKKCERLNKAKVGDNRYQYDKYDNGKWELDTSFYDEKYNGGTKKVGLQKYKKILKNV